jgi:hypothetical protein
MRGGRAATLAKCTLDIYCALIYYVKLHTVAHSIFIDGGGRARQCCAHHGNADVKGASRGASDAQGEDKATTLMMRASIAKGSQCTKAE